MNKALDTLSGFWTVFQEGVAHKDMETLKSISDMEELGADFYNDYFFESVQKVVAAAGVEQIVPSEDMGEGYYQFTIHQEGTAIALYFNKNASGDYKVATTMAFG